MLVGSVMVNSANIQALNATLTGLGAEARCAVVPTLIAVLLGCLSSAVCKGKDWTNCATAGLSCDASGAVVSLYEFCVDR